jgi:hypothetical protein
MFFALDLELYGLDDPFAAHDDGIWIEWVR